MQISLYTVKKTHRTAQTQTKKLSIKITLSAVSERTVFECRKKQISRSKNSKQKTERKKYKWRLKKYIIK